MKLLLTSAGLRNESIVNALQELVEKPFSELNFAFIPTAANVEPGDKWWLVEDINNAQKLGWKQFDIVDFSAVVKNIWLSRLKEADVILLSGGSSFHLMDSIDTLEGKEEFMEILKSKTYIGISAGSMITTKHVQFGWDRDFYGIETPKDQGEGLGFVDFHIMPHWGDEEFSKVNEENVGQLAKDIDQTIYLLDNSSAIQVLDGSIKVISECEWRKFN